MHLTLTLVAGLTLPGTIPNLDLSGGKVAPWQGDGGKMVLLGTTRVFTTADDGTTRKAILHRTFTVPPGAIAIEFTAAAFRPEGVAAGDMLDVVLEAAKREAVPCQVRQGDKWLAAPALLGPNGGQLREYRWPLDRYAGKRVRIAVVDSDDRAGCHVVTSGFRLLTRDDLEAQKFVQHMRDIQDKHRTAKPLRYDSTHFMALSTAGAAYSDYRLHNCETIHALFFEHFRKRGFTARIPTEKLMVAIFDSQDGLDAYMGQKIPSSVTGLYHPATNRLVVYDYGTNRAFASGVARAAVTMKGGSSDLEREANRVKFSRAVRDRRDDTNISTVMHEVAHQLSFNCGMLNRKGDVPVWLAEGLAVYCESTVKGAWQGIGEANPARAGVLVPASRGDAPFIPLRDLIQNDDWIRKAKRTEQIVLGYSQSWALFRMLMDERPKQLEAYLRLIHDRKTPDHRLTDFGTAFGADLVKLENRYHGYMHAIVRKEKK
jgi:Protein of unknown function (DUF1570)